MADFMRIKYENPKLKRTEIANQLGCSTSTLQRYRNDIIRLSRYRIQTNTSSKRLKKASNTNFDNNSHHEHDLKIPQKTSNDLAKLETNTKSNKKNKNILKGGSVQENIEYNDENLGEILHKNDL